MISLSVFALRSDHFESFYACSLFSFFLKKKKDESCLLQSAESRCLGAQYSQCASRREPGRSPGHARTQPCSRSARVPTAGAIGARGGATFKLLQNRCFCSSRGNFKRCKFCDLDPRFFVLGPSFPIWSATYLRMGSNLCSIMPFLVDTKNKSTF